MLLLLNVSSDAHTTQKGKERDSICAESFLNTTPLFIFYHYRTLAQCQGSWGASSTSSWIWMFANRLSSNDMQRFMYAFCFCSSIKRWHFQCKSWLLEELKEQIIVQKPANGLTTVITSKWPALFTCNQAFMSRCIWFYAWLCQRAWGSARV